MCIRDRWPVVPNSHPYNSVSHAENPRGIGLVDLVYALEEGRKPRASGEMALHSLEVMECILKSAHAVSYTHLDVYKRQVRGRWYHR